MSVVRSVSSAYLDGFSLLPVPVWIFDIDNQRIWWGNEAALALWKAESLDELRARDFSDMTSTAKERLRIYQQRFLNGHIFQDRWTLYPGGEPKVVEMTCSGVLIDGDHLSLLALAGDSIDIASTDISNLRMVEALRYSSAMVSLYDLSGCALVRNPAAISVLGDTILPGGELYSELLEPTAFARLIATLDKGEEFQEELEVLTVFGPRWHVLDAQSVIDPATGYKAILVNERDVTEHRAIAQSQRDLAERLFVEQTRATAAVQAKTKFLDSVSHDVAAPLAGVMAMLDSLGAGELSSSQRELAHAISASIASLRSAVDGILTDAHSEAGKGLSGGLPNNVAAVTPAAVGVGTSGMSDVMVLNPEALNVLVVEDNSINQQVAVGLLGKLGCRVELANDGREAFSLLQRSHYDLVFMDLQMPHMDGIAATKAIRAVLTDKADIPIIAMTANAMPDDRAICLAAGMNDYMAKPIRLAGLLDVLERWASLRSNCVA